MTKYSTLATDEREAEEQVELLNEAGPAPSSKSGKVSAVIAILLTVTALSGNITL